jgi:hypothetical protein
MNTISGNPMNALYYIRYPSIDGTLRLVPMFQVGTAHGLGGAGVLGPRPCRPGFIARAGPLQIPGGAPLPGIGSRMDRRVECIRRSRGLLPHYPSSYSFIDPHIAL